jgi:hypothetical protein
MKIDIPHHLSDEQLVVQVKALAHAEQEATARLIAYLAEFDARRLYLAAGFSSLFAYCCEVLRLSEPAAYNRIEVARGARRFSDILRMLGQGSLSLATARLLGAELTADNQEGLLAAAAGKSKRQVEEMLARSLPQADVPSSIRKLPVAKASSAFFNSDAAGIPRVVAIGPCSGSVPGRCDAAPTAFGATADRETARG